MRGERERSVTGARESVGVRGARESVDVRGAREECEYERSVGTRGTRKEREHERSASGKIANDDNKNNSYKTNNKKRKQTELKG